MKKVDVELIKVDERIFYSKIYINDKLLYRTNNEMYAQIRRIIKDKASFRIPTLNKILFDNNGISRLNNYSPITVQGNKVVYKKK